MRSIFRWLFVFSVMTAAVAVARAQESDEGDGAAAQTRTVELKRREPDLPYMSDAKFQKAYAEAKGPGRMTVDEVLARWKKAAKASDNQCVDCLSHVLRWEMHQSEWKDAVKTSDLLVAASSEPKDELYASVSRGTALLQLAGEKPKPEMLQDADLSLRTALRMAPNEPGVIFAEGRVLALLGRESEAKEMFQKYVSLTGPSDSLHSRAEHFAENPHLATMRMAPPFKVTTSAGEQMSLDDMGGKVVLLDFWATWCGPCKESLPEVQRIAKEFKNDPFVLISVSGDQNDEEWKKFVASHNMTWPQYRDANGDLSVAYGVNSIPRYFTIDTDGVLQSVKVGPDAAVMSDLRRLVKRAREAEKKKAEAGESHGGE